jgi:hypothetical protein
MLSIDSLGAKGGLSCFFLFTMRDPKRVLHLHSSAAYADKCVVGVK